MHKYRLIGKKGEGTFSEVLKAQGIKNGKYVAIKCMKNHFDSLDQVNNLREIQALRRLSPHPGVIKLCEVLYDQPTRRLALVFELMDMNIYELIRGRRQYLQEQRIKNYMYQLLKSMDHMHRNGIFHRDIKPENILITDDELKLADFGSCRGIYSKQPYTEYISTRWYRAPECLLTDGFYNYKMDMWGVGCVFFEVLSLYPLFPGTNELDQVNKIHAILGTPPAETLAKLKKHSNSHIDFNFPHKEGSPMAKLIPHCSPDCIDVIVRLLAYDPDDRISARQAVKHTYFKDLRKNELDAKQAEAKTQGATGDGDAVADDRTYAPAGAATQSVKGKGKAVEGSGVGGSGMLPQIDKGKPDHRSKHTSKEIGGGSSAVQYEPASAVPAQADAGAPSQQALPYVQNQVQDFGEDGSSGTLPPIGGFGAAANGGTLAGGGVGGLKIESQSLMRGTGKSLPKNAPQVQKHRAPVKKMAGMAGGLGGGLGVGGSRVAAGQLGPTGFGQGQLGSGIGIASGACSGAIATSMQTRSCASCDMELGGGESSVHIAPTFGSKKTYQSPYSQRHAAKQK